MASGGEVTYCLCIECCRLYRLATFVVANAAFVSSVISSFNSESFISFFFKGHTVFHVGRKFEVVKEAG